MPIPAPILDDRSYQQLRDELVRRIPVYTPEWTDFNASDPGITLIELFAFLGENLLFRFNQIPESARLEFLRLLQIPLRPACPANALVTLTTDKLVPDGKGALTGALVAIGSQLKAGSVPFESQTETRVWPLSAIAVGRVRASPPDPTTEPDVHEFAIRTLDALGGLKPGQAAAFYENRTVDLELPAVDFGATVDQTLWIALLLPKPPKDDTDYNRDLKNYTDALLNIGFIPDPTFPSLGEVTPSPGVSAPPPSPPLEWQVSAGTDAKGQPVFRSLAVEGDTSRGLTQEGVIRIRLPKEPGDLRRPTITDPDLRGTGPWPPALDESAEARVLLWVKAFRPNTNGFRQLGRVAFVGINAIEVAQTQRARAEFLGTGTGQPDQTFPLINGQIIARSVALEVEEPAGWQAWAEVDDFHASRGDDRHFTVDREGGQVKFGNGLQGFPPQIGQRIRVREYRYGGGTTGNVAAQAINQVTSHPDIKGGNPLRARGGADAESVRDALGRIPAEFRRHDRAVTASDFQELALATPGAGVGRAECLPRFHPPTRQSNAAGVISVVVWPREDPVHPSAPVPDRTLLRSVCAWLDARRLVTTELYVIPPTYRRVAVAVGLEAKPGYGVEAVRRWVELVIRQYLAPLPPYGPEGQGWPLGRRVYGPELEAAALQVEGVQFLTGLAVAGWNGTSWIPGTVSLESWEVPELAVITVEDGPPTLAPGQGVAPPSTPDVPVPVPILREEC